MTKNETWSGQRIFPVKGHYFELLESSAAVDIVARAADGTVVCDERQVDQGFYIDRRGREPFVELAITTGSSHAVKFGVSDGSLGNRAVPSDITSDAARLLGIVYGNLGQLAQLAVGGVNALQVTPRGIIAGAAYSSVTAIAAATPEAVFLPAANTGGAILWDCEFLSANGAGAGYRQCAFIDHTAAPGAFTTGRVVCGPHDFVVNGAAVEILGRRDSPIYIAAGRGLYYYSTVAETAAARAARYTLLP